MISKRWHFLAGVLAVLAGLLACSLPAPTLSQAPTQTPRPIPTLEKPRIAPIPSRAPLSGTVSALRSLYVRSGSNYRSEPLGVLYHGQEVELTRRCSGVWAEIRFEGSRAWVNGRYITGDTCEEEG